jgi:chitin disaccharide deacetylase
VDIQEAKAGSLSAPAIRMIVNADDFGYFDAVSRGIIEAMTSGTVTATGVMANGPALERWVDRLRAQPGISVGVHLNATLGQPLTNDMRAVVGDAFPSKAHMATALLLGRVPLQALLAEWRAQIERCQQLSLKLAFVNSHEHLHMLPKLYARVRTLAGEFGIAHVRAPQPEWGPRLTLAAVVRSGAFFVTQALASRSPGAEPTLIGVAPSGRLDNSYCRWRFARLQAGKTYELMCHPGWNDPLAQRAPALAAYHDWEGELRTVMGATFRQLLAEHGITLVNFSE